MTRKGIPLVKRINNFDCQKFILQSHYTMMKYQMNISQIEKMRDIGDFESYLEAYQIEYVPLIDIHIGQTAQHKDGALPSEKQEHEQSQSQKKEPESSTSLFANLFNFSRATNNDS